MKDQNDDRYSRQSFLGADCQDRFENCVVGLVGLGGGGSHIVQQLAHLGFKQYRIFDADHVTGSNLNRLVGATTNDAGLERPKIEVAKRMILGLQPEADIQAFPCRWQDKPGKLRECQLVFGCLDTYIGRDELEAFCRRYMLVYIDIGMDVVIGTDKIPVIGGQVILSVPGKACMRCMEFLTPERLAAEAALYGDAGGRPQVVWCNGVLASTAVGTAIESLTAFAGDSMPCLYLQYDGNRRLLKAHYLASSFETMTCGHYPETAVGKPIFTEL